MGRGSERWAQGSGVNPTDPLGSQETFLQLKVKTISVDLLSVTTNIPSDEEEEDIQHLLHSASVQPTLTN